MCRLWLREKASGWCVLSLPSSVASSVLRPLPASGATSPVKAVCAVVRGAPSCPANGVGVLAARASPDVDTTNGRSKAVRSAWVGEGAALSFCVSPFWAVTMSAGALSVGAPSIWSVVSWPVAALLSATCSSRCASAFASDDGRERTLRMRDPRRRLLRAGPCCGCIVSIAVSCSWSGGGGASSWSPGPSCPAAGADCVWPRGAWALAPSGRRGLFWLRSVSTP